MQVPTHPRRAWLAAPAIFLCTVLGPLHAQELSISLQPVVSGLDQPIGIENAGDSRLFIIEQAGVVELLVAGSLESPPFLDVSDRVTTGNEQGLLGLAFHPDYDSNGEFFIHYTDTQGDTVIELCVVSAGDFNVGDCSAEDIVFTLPQPAANHNGGKIAFGPDGYLYVALGDGGGAGDPNENAQDITDLHGAILRLDVDGDDFPGDPDRDYAIPPDNPFVGQAGADEIWAYGLRNPWRFSFDRLSGDLWIGDVGQADWEEIDYEPVGGPGGRNYGWDVLEGTHCFEDDPGGDGSCADFLNGGSTLPVAEIDSSGTGNCSVTGGFRYRGVSHPELLGYYVYGDFCSGRIWTLRPDCSGGWVNQEVADTDARIASFGEGGSGELYLVDRSAGTLYLVNAEPVVARLLTASIDVIQFGEHSVGDIDSEAVLFEYSGAGPDNLQIDEFGLSDTDHFIVATNGGSDPCGATPVSLGPADDCSISVFFAPERQGDFDEMLCVSGNMPEVAISLRATVPCSGPDNDTVENVIVSDDSYFSACLHLTGGPNVAVETGFFAEFRAGQSLAINGEFTVEQGASMALVVDPVLAQP